MFTHELPQPFVAPKLNRRWRLKLLGRLLVVFEAIATPPRLIRNVGPGLPPESEHEFRPPTYYYR